MTPTGTATTAFAHPALFYRGEREYLDGIVPFVREGLKDGEPVAVAVPAPRLSALREALGADASAVHLVDMRVAGRNPGRIIPTVLRAFADRHRDTPVRIVGEPIWPGRSGLEYPACVQHEALINLAFHGRAVTILCPYDADRLDGTALTDARATHPVVLSAGTAAASPSYAPEAVVARYNRPLPPPPPSADRVAFVAEDLSDTRHRAVGRAGRLGLTGVRSEDFALVVAELTTNSVVHGGGSGTLHLWAEGSSLVCQVRDGGHLGDPLAGRRPAAPDRPGGRGLLLVHRLCDLVRVHTTPGDTTVRVYLDL
ncbi:anti-sigma factor RsbA family regulatory protein [Streptomyces antibioticus]|uniref:anti-sigma factor RsbA family regulatory protein n=1 Tax=Streptomyces antibioticus TaxID=1890 RepID=UPI0034032CE5